MSHQMVELPEEVDFFDPRTTHLVANIEDLTDVLEGATEEADDTNEEAGEYADSQSPVMVSSASGT